MGSDLDVSTEDDSDLEHTPPPKGKYKIPKYTINRSAEQILALRRDFPLLNHYDDKFFKTVDMTVLLSLNAHVGGGLESKRSKKLAERMARNLEAVKKNP